MEEGGQEVLDSRAAMDVVIDLESSSVILDYVSSVPGNPIGEGAVAVYFLPLATDQGFSAPIRTHNSEPEFATLASSEEVTMGATTTLPATPTGEDSAPGKSVHAYELDSSDAALSKESRQRIVRAKRSKRFHEERKNKIRFYAEELEQSRRKEADRLKEKEQHEQEISFFREKILSLEQGKAETEKINRDLLAEKEVDKITFRQLEENLELFCFKPIYFYEDFYVGK